MNIIVEEKKCCLALHNLQDTNETTLRDKSGEA